MLLVPRLLQPQSMLLAIAVAAAAVVIIVIVMRSLFHTKNASPTPNSRPILIPFYLFGRMYVQICEILKLWAN